MTDQRARAEMNELELRARKIANELVVLGGAAREAELEKHKAMLKRSIEDECDAEQLLVAAGISDYEEGERGEYRGLHTQIELYIKQRDTARQDAARLREALELVITEWSNRGETTYLYEWGNRVKDAVEQAQRALKGA